MGEEYRLWEEAGIIRFVTQTSFGVNHV